MDWHKAVEDFDKCIELDENYTKAYIKKGDCLSFMKEFHKAKGAYEKAKSQDPTNQEVLKKM